MANPIGTYSSSFSGRTSSGTNDFFQLRTPSSGYRLEVIELRLFQTSSTTLAMYAIQIARGTGTITNTGTATTIYEWDTGGQGGQGVGGTNQTTLDNLGSLNLAYFVGWNILQEFVWLPTPKYPLIMRAGEKMSLSFITGANLSGLGGNIVWEEYGA